MPSYRCTLVCISLLAAVVRSQGGEQDADLEARFQGTRERVATAVGEAFRRSPGAVVMLRTKLHASEADCSLAIDHLQRLPERSPAVATDLLRLASKRDACGLLAAIAIGNVAPWWPEQLRADAQRVLADRFARGGVGTSEQAAMSRSWTRATLRVTRDVASIEAMLRSEDPFQVEFALHQVSCVEHAGRPLLPLLREIAAVPRWVVQPSVRGTPRELPCMADWTPLVRDQLYWAVRRVEPGDPAGLTLYLERWQQASACERVDYAQQFGRMGTAGAAALPQLQVATRAGDRLLAREAVTALGMIGVADAPTLARLHELVGGSDRQLRACARAALRRLESATPAVSR